MDHPAVESAGSPAESTGAPEAEEVADHVHRDRNVAVSHASFPRPKPRRPLNATSSADRPPRNPTSHAPAEYLRLAHDHRHAGSRYCSAATDGRWAINTSPVTACGVRGDSAGGDVKADRWSLKPSNVDAISGTLMSDLQAAWGVEAAKGWKARSHADVMGVYFEAEARRQAEEIERMQRMQVRIQQQPGGRRPRYRRDGEDSEEAGAFVVSGPPEIKPGGSRVTCRTFNSDARQTVCEAKDIGIRVRDAIGLGKGVSPACGVVGASCVLNRMWWMFWPNMLGKGAAGWLQR
ncbi:hypothetical protein HK101_009945, partial [Irineochytrium annulatum]